MQADHLISVVIPAHNDGDHLKRLLPSLMAGFAGLGTAHEIIVVANGCTDDTVASCPPGVRCLERPALCPAAARNAGAAEAKGRWLAFIDADVVPLPSWFKAVDAIVERPRHDGRDAFLVGWPVLAPSDSSWVARAWEKVRFSADHLPRTLDCANIIVPREFFERIGRFNANRIAGEDVEICEDAMAHGGEILFDQNLAVYHYGEPRRLSEFFSREMFHADPLPLVVRNCMKSGLDATLTVMVLSLLLGVVGAVLAVSGGPVWAWVLLLLAPAASAAAAFAKAFVRRRRSLERWQFVEMVFLCHAMMTARLAGMIIRRRTWRTGTNASA